MDISDCALARESISADLDGELQELDLRRLQAHLHVCAVCSEWAGRAKATTTKMREAPVEAPVAAVFALSGRRRTWRVSPALAIAPAAALVAGVAVVLGGALHGAPGRPATSTRSTDHHTQRSVPDFSRTWGRPPTG